MPTTEDVKPGPSKAKTSWIYNLSKEDLIQELQRFGLDTEGTLEKLRDRMNEFVKSLTRKPTSQGETKPTADCLSETPRTQTHICETVRKWNVHFNGKTDPITFLERVKELQQSYHVSNEQMLTVLPELLKDNAILWYRNNYEQWKDWENFSQDFQAYYIPDNKLRLQEAINRRIHRVGETGTDYVTELQTMMRRHGGYSCEQQIQRLYLNLRPEYRQRIRYRDVPSIPALLREVQEYEDLQRELKITSTRNTETPLRPRVCASVPTDRNPKPVCWRCGKEGHFRQNCTNPAFCSRCGREGILSRDCTCANESGNG